MKLKPPTHPDQAFVKRGTFEKILAEMKKAAGLTVQPGDVSRWPKGRSVLFKARPRTIPFGASGRADFIRLNAGVVTYAGRSFFFPSAAFSGPGGGLVGLRVPVRFIVTPVFVSGVEQPWSAVFESDLTPTFEWQPPATVGNHARIRNPPDDPDTGIGNHTLEVEDGSVFFPVAGWSGSRVVNHVSGNLVLKAEPTGRLILSTF